MTKLVVFEGADEVIIVAAENVNTVVKQWFLEGQRSLDSYNVYLTDAAEGFSITTGVSFNDNQMKDFDVTELMSADLRKELVAAELLVED